MIEKKERNCTPCLRASTCHAELVKTVQVYHLANQSMQFWPAFLYNNGIR